MVVKTSKANRADRVAAMRQSKVASNGGSNGVQIFLYTVNRTSRTFEQTAMRRAGTGLWTVPQLEPLLLISESPSEPREVTAVDGLQDAQHHQ
ncbi:hypothetical protein B0G71_8175 [Paraburkholderia sp. BL27I4N3]|nr:hypothetical protein B0G71_8175 [Paraburkholderia sp. BL27I4N3]